MRDRLPVLGRLYAGSSLVVMLLAASATVTAAQDTMRITKDNLPQALKKMAQSLTAGMRVNDHMTVKQASASGNTFTVTYVIDTTKIEISAADVTKEDVEVEEKSMCALDNLRILMKYGAAFERVYEDSHGAAVYKARVNQQRCRSLS